MKFSFSNIQNDLLLEYVDDSSINPKSILKVLIDELLHLEEEKIDVEKSTFEKSDSNYRLVLVGKDEKYCRVFFEILFPNIVDIQLNQGGEYLFVEPVNDLDDLHNFRQTVRDLLKSEIREQLVFRNKKIIKASYEILHKIGEKEFWQEYSIFLDNIWPWQKRKNLNRCYKSWV